MRYVGISLLALALAASWAWAGSPVANDPAFADVQQAVIGTSTSTPDDQQVPIRPGVASTGRDFAAEAAAASRNPLSTYQGDQGRESPPGILWRADRRIRTGNSPSWGRLSMDNAENGNLYVCLYSPYGTPQDTVFVYRSTDNGMNWTEWQYSNNTSGSDSIVDAFIRVGPGTNPWVYTFVHYATSGGGLFARRQRADGTNNSWIQIARGDTVRYISADRNIESPSTLFMSFKFGATLSSMRLIASYDSAATWTNGRTVTSGTQTNPRVCAGGDGYVYLSYIQDTSTVRVVRYTNNLVSPTFVFNSVDTTAAREGTYQQAIAAARTTPGTSQAAWILNAHRHGANVDIHMSTTVNGGVNWATAPWPVSNTGRTEWDMRYPDLRYSYNYSANLVSGIATFAGTYDSVAYAYAMATSPTTWQSRGVYNDYNATGEFGATVGNTVGMGGPGIAYRQFGSGTLWFDWWSNTSGVEQGPANASPLPGLKLASAQPNPVSRSTAIAFTLPKSGEVDLAVYDIAGRKVATLAQGVMSAGSHEVSWNGAEAPAGVYLYRLSFEGQILTNRMTVVR